MTRGVKIGNSENQQRRKSYLPKKEGKINKKIIPGLAAIILSVFILIFTDISEQKIKAVFGISFGVVYILLENFYNLDPIPADKKIKKLSLKKD